MKRFLAPVALLVAAVAAVTVALTSGPDRPERDPAAVVIPFAPRQVSRLVVHAEERRAEVVRTSDGVWQAQPGTSPQSATLLFNLEESLLPVRAYRAITGDPVDAQYGLADPDLLVEITGSRGARRVLAIGGPAFTGAGYYSRLDGSTTGGPTRLYLVPRQTVDVLRSVATGQPVKPADRVGAKLAEVEAEQLEAAEQARMRPYLRQAIDAGGARMPEGLE